jgi:UDP-glucose 4-epimerase
VNVNSAAKKSPNRFLVTGGAGFIGNRVVTELLGKSSENHVAVLDNLSVGMPLPTANARLHCFQADIRDAAETKRIMADFKPDTVVHLAAVHHIPTCEKQRSYSLDVNVIGTETLLHAMEEAGVNRFVLASSGAVYDWHDGALSEDASPLRPADNYSLAKHTNEKQVAFWAERTSGMVRIARIFNTIGHDDPNAHLIPDIISQIPSTATTAKIGLGNLTPRRDYIHADDTARAIAALAQDVEGSACDIFNVATGKDVSVGELVELLGSVMAIPIQVVEDAARKRRVDRPSQLGNPLKLQNRFGVVPRKSLRIALEDIVRHSGRLPTKAS